MTGPDSEGGGCVVGAWAGLRVAIGQGGPRAETRLVGARGAMVGPELRGLSSCRRRKW